MHCGFCTAACPTYRLLGDERDGPRGRIYLIKQVLEGEAPTASTQIRLDRCLTCRSCETACPSGVAYGRLLDIGRQVVEEKVGRPWLDKSFRLLLRTVLPYRRRFGAVLALARGLKPVLPSRLQAKLPAASPAGAWPPLRHARRVILLQGCVQPALAPDINPATARVLDRLGISAVVAPEAGCCGALSQHLSAQDEALDFARRNVDAWWPLLESGAEAVVVNASGCGAMVKEYGHLLRRDPAYADKAARVGALAKDIVEVLAAENLDGLAVEPRTVAFHSPCTLQHGQKLNGVTESVLRRLGFDLAPVADAHLCCGSAGTYSLLQPRLSQQLLEQKLAALEAGQPECIATANIGCLTHLQSGAARPVRHWIELLDSAWNQR
ncbi:glycolate oxidase iron-sulfur subunit [Methylogaea oryzae]|uniref:Glycolate oxidase iron-sulfur subunit n=2 Tax=Methylogaea oryzae TaxID=1295382 RepID=A0A8D4VUW5_9GAMM|nr:glycolate oxidase iron-sulfur subunit [Methylogaea oryzae]